MQLITSHKWETNYIWGDDSKILNDRKNTVCISTVCVKWVSYTSTQSSSRLIYQCQYLTSGAKMSACAKQLAKIGKTGEKHANPN